MLTLLLQNAPQPALDAIHQDLQKIVSTLQNPPGAHEWVKTVLTLSAGGVLGFCASIALEFVRPWIQGLLTRRRIAPKLSSEFEENMQTVEAALRMMKLSESLEDQKRDEVLRTVSILCGIITRSSFDLYMEKEKEGVHDLKGSSSLIAFYETFGSQYRQLVREDEVVGATALMALASLRGENYIRSSRLHYKSRKHTLESVYEFSNEVDQARRAKKMSIGSGGPEHGTDS